MLRNYAPDRVDAVVLITDGRNDDPSGMSLAQLKQSLKPADPDKPIAITTIGVGPDADAAALDEISHLAYSRYFGATNPAEITAVLASAFFDHRCTNGRCVWPLRAAAALRSCTAATACRRGPGTTDNDVTCCLNVHPTW